MISNLTNGYIFLYATMAIFLLQLLAIMAILYIGFALCAWPIRIFMRKFRLLIRRGGSGYN